jgi:hypothetical protein
LIGRPISNVKIYVLDSHQQPVPIGVSGELYIGGAGVARGYLNRPELTAERFIRNPLGTSEEDRLYRSGDLVRYHADGNLEFLGRIDHQVKIRGYRIEVGEIEAVIRENDWVKDCAVIARDNQNEKQLVAYIASDKSESSAAELRQSLSEKLPTFMIPAAFVFLERLPMTPNGKLDQKALPAPTTHRPETQNAYVAPESETEQLVANIWKELLGLQQVGRDDNFFDLGGHSLLMVRAHQRLCSSLKKQIPIVDLFRYPTVSSLAQSLRVPESNTSRIEQLRNRAARQRNAVAQVTRA